MSAVMWPRFVTAATKYFCSLFLLFMLWSLPIVAATRWTGWDELNWLHVLIFPLALIYQLRFMEWDG